MVGLAGIFASYYARGYRFDYKKFKFQPNGILVIKSEPDGASIYINNELKAATNSSISLSPGTYDVEIRKEGYLSWYKRLTIQKEEVTQADVSLFKNVPSLAPVTLSGANNPVISPDGSKIAYLVLPNTNLGNEKAGLWTIDTYSLPFGFGGGSKKITDGDLTGAAYTFSPDGRQILLSVSNATFLLDSGSFISQSERVNIASKKESTIKNWALEKSIKDQNMIKGLPGDLPAIFSKNISNFVFSADNSMILYTASTSATINPGLSRELPGASTQTQERSIKPGQTYIYDIKEDRNFLIADFLVTINNSDNPLLPAVRWMSTSKHLLLTLNGQVIIMDYDGTNRQVVYSGSYVFPNAFPFANATRLLILTNLGSPDSITNLYTLTVK